MNPRKRLLFLALVLGGAVVAVPALASSEPSPTVSGLESIMWSPSEASLEAGGTVTFQNTSGVVPHGVVWESGNPETPVCNGVPIDEGKTEWKGSCTFAKAGTYRYYCYVHGMAMSGTIDVSSASTTPTTTPTATTPPGGGATTPSPPTPAGESGSVETAGSPLSGSASAAIKLAGTQHGRSVHGSVQVSRAGAGARLEVDLLLRGASRGKSGHSPQVRVGGLVRSSLRAGSVPFSVPLNAKGREALRRHGHLKLSVKITLVPVHGAAVTATRVVIVRG